MTFITLPSKLAAGMDGRLRSLCIALVATAAFALLASPVATAQVVGVPPAEIPGDPMTSSPEFTGGPATPRRVGNPNLVPRHPFMAPSGRNNIHGDAYMTDTHASSGPLGDGAETSAFFVRECGSVMFDSQGRIVTICVGLDFPVLALLDPVTLEPLAAMQLPPRMTSDPFGDFTGGGYFYLDDQDRAVYPTSQRHVQIASPDPPSFTVDRDFDLTGVIPSGDSIVSVLPDWGGRLWFVTRAGRVGTVNRASGAARVLKLRGEGISNSFAVDETGGVFIVSDQALYRFDAGRGGAPRVTWRLRYPDSGIHKPGQSDAGSGTTPTLMRRGRGALVAITDNANPMNVLVAYRAKRRPRRPGSTRRARRVVCKRPVFAKGASATDNSLIATRRSLVVENNYGYDEPLAGDELTSPGLARVDVRRRNRGCKRVWYSGERGASVVPKLSIANGLVYTYTKPSTESAWFLTALDFRTGRTIYRRPSGTGFGHNNNYAPVTIGPDGTAYVGVLGGLVRFSH